MGEQNKLPPFTPRDLVRLKETELRREALAFRRYQFDKTHSDNGIMRDNTSCKFPGFSISSTTRSLLICGTAIVVFYAIYKSTKTKNEIKLVNAKADANLRLYVGKKKADLQYGKSSKSESECDSSVITHNPSEETTMQEPQDFKDVIKEGVKNGGVKPIQSDYLNAGDLVFLYGSKGSGKSAAVAQLGFSFATGIPSGMFPYEQANIPLPVFWIDTELTSNDHAKRYEGKLEEIPSDVIKRVTGLDYQEFDDCVADIRRNVWEKTSGYVVLVDNPTVTLNVTNANKVRKFMWDLRNLQKEYYETFHAFLTILVVGHMEKAGKNFMGSEQLGNIATKMYQLTKDEANPDIRKLLVVKDRSAAKDGQELTLRMTDSDNWLHMEFVSLSDPRHQPIREVVDGRKNKAVSDNQLYEIWEALRNGAKPKELAETYSVDVRTIYRYRKNMPGLDTCEIDNSSENDELSD